jgi:hypothetical protein
MEYEGSIGLVTRKMKKFIDDFHVLGLFMTKNFFSVCHAPLPPLLHKFGSRLQPPP